MVMNMLGKIVLAAAAVSSAMVVSAFAAGKVACVGNSITYGYGIESWPDQTSYPHHLQGMLRENAPNDTVENFGVSGLTVRKDDQASYWKGYRFAPAIEFAADTVIIELGTNDSKSYTTWNTPEQDAAVDSAITADFEALIDTFQVKSKPHVFICLAPYVNNIEWNILDTAVVKRVKSVEGAKHLAEIVYAHLQMDTLQVTQEGSLLKAPKGFYGFQWYKDGKLLEGETLETLVVTGEGEYKVSVRLSANAHSRIVTAPLKVEKTTALKPGARVARKNSAGAANMAKSVQRFDAQGRTLNARGPSHQKIYIKR